MVRTESSGSASRGGKTSLKQVFLRRYDLRAMIRLRAAVVRGLRHPWLGPALALLLAVLLVLLVLHAVVHEASVPELVVCAVIALAVTRLLALPLPTPPTRLLLLRGPPVLLAAARVPACSRHGPPPPLRL